MLLRCTDIFRELHNKERPEELEATPGQRPRQVTFPSSGPREHGPEKRTVQILPTGLAASAQVLDKVRELACGAESGMLVRTYRPSGIGG